MFPDAFTCEVGFLGPLYIEDKTRNKFRIDAGKRTGTLREPKWGMITSEYPDTTQNYLVLAMDEQEMLAEKIIALMRRGKGRDLYDTWFLLKKGVILDKRVLKSKTDKEGIRIKNTSILTRREYERDMTKLTRQMMPYLQVKKEVTRALTDRG